MYKNRAHLAAKRAAQTWMPAHRRIPIKALPLNKLTHAKTHLLELINLTTVTGQIHTETDNYGQGRAPDNRQHSAVMWWVTGANVVQLNYPKGGVRKKT